jgi:hypothetical protein
MKNFRRAFWTVVTIGAFWFLGAQYIAYLAS